MKSIQTITLNLKNSDAYFTATNICGLAFHYSDKHLNYNIKTVEGVFEPSKKVPKFDIILRLNFQNTGELTKLNDCLQLLTQLDLLAHDFDEEDKTTDERDIRKYEED